MQHAVRDALIGFMAATAQAQAEATKAAQRAGIAHAKANDGRWKFAMSGPHPPTIGRVIDRTRGTTRRRNATSVLAVGPDQ